MKKVISVIVILLAMCLFTGCKKSIDQLAAPKQGETVAEISVQGYGSIYVKFFDAAAPKAVENFVTHAKEGYYDGLTFHRIIEDFMIQGGDPTGTGMGGESIWGKNFNDEFTADLQPIRGALCMANSGPDTNGSQFFIVQSKQAITEDIFEQMEEYYGIKLDDKAKKLYSEVGGTPWLFEKHTVFGQVFEGLDVLDDIAKVEKEDEEQGIPATEVIIEKITISDYEK